MSAIDSLPPLAEVIKTHEIAARKSLGQNFLLDLNLTAKIARQAGDLTACDVLEIGPGPGGLTRSLFKAGAESVIAIEIGRRVGLPLEGIGFPGHFLVGHQDLPGSYADMFHGGQILDRRDCEAMLDDMSNGSMSMLAEMWLYWNIRRVSTG